MPFELLSFHEPNLENATSRKRHQAPGKREPHASVRPSAPSPVLPVPVADGLVVLAAAAVAYLLRLDASVRPLEAATTPLLTAITGVSALSGLSAHQPPKRLSTQLCLSLAVWGVLAVSLAVFATLSQPLDRGFQQWARAWAALALSGIVVTRVLLWAGTAWLAQGGRLTPSVALVDLSDAGETCARRLTELAANDIRLMGVWRGIQGVRTLVSGFKAARIDEILISSSASNPELPEAMRLLAGVPAGLHLWPEPEYVRCMFRSANGIFGTPAFRIARSPPSGLGAFAKRAEDITLASIVLLVIAPVLPLIALAIRIDSPGPILFRQPRLGFNNEEFVIYKFRSMRHQPASGGPVLQATRADPRVSRVGAFLRRTSLDELPQIINVLRGDMSLVGPRPHAVPHHYAYQDRIEGYLGRHRMRPGLTGWAQVHGFRGETDTLEKMRNRVLYDLDYIENWSIWLDIRILVMSVFLVIYDRHAY